MSSNPDGSPPPGGDGGASGGGDGKLSLKEQEQLSLQSSAFDALERDFREVLSELVGDKSLERFRLEYEKLHHALKKSHESEKRLIHRCHALKAEVMLNATKVHNALRMARSDQNNIALLEKEIENTWKIVDAAQEKERKAREQIQRLNREIEKLSRIVDQGAGLSINQEHAVNELLKEKEELQQQVKQRTQALTMAEQKVLELTERAQELEQKKFAADAESHELRSLNNKLKAKADRSARLTERLQGEIATLKSVSDDRMAALENKNDAMAALQHQYDVLEEQKQQMDMAMERVSNIAAEFRSKNMELEKQVQIHVQNETALMEAKAAAEQQAEEERGRTLKVTQQLQAMQREHAKTKKALEKMTESRAEAERARDMLRGEIVQMRKEVELQARHADTDDKLIRELQQQVKRLTGSLASSKDKNQMQLNLVKNYEEIKKSLEDRILRHKTEEERLRQRNYELEKQREKASMQAANVQARFQESQEVVKMKEMEISEQAKKISEEKNKLKLQQALYEQVRADRNLFSKQHIQSQDEIAEMKRKFQIMTHQIEQLKEEIQAKDRALINEHFVNKRYQDEVKVFQRKLAKRDEVLKAADQVLNSQDAEISSLRGSLADAKSAQKQQKGVYDDVAQERDILGQRLMARNDELALLYEKVRIQQSTLSKGELQYKDRLREIRALRLQLNDLKRELHLRSSEVSNVEALKAEVHHLQKELLHERSKVKALTEELENPMNVHRWRKLEGSDPKRFELIQKIQTLQKRLITKTEEVVEKDLLLQEKERLYVELKNILARQPGPEVAEQLNAHQHSLKEKTRQLKAMAAEMNMLQVQVKEYRFEVERLTRELHEAKRRYYDQRRKDQAAQLDEADLLAATAPLPGGPGTNPEAERLKLRQQQEFQAKHPVVAGGGFTLKRAEKTT